MDSERLKATLRAAEGERLKPYLDTVGKWTIGCGRNLSDNGISRSEMDFMLQNDVTAAYLDAQKLLPTFLTLDDVRQRVLTEMVFQMGYDGVRAFKRTLLAITAGEYDRAADEMLDSEWAVQTPGRAHRLAQMMRSGADL